MPKHLGEGAAPQLLAQVRNGRGVQVGGGGGGGGGVLRMHMMDSQLAHALHKRSRRKLLHLSSSLQRAQARLAYDKMRADGVAPNARFYTEFIRICGRAGNLTVGPCYWKGCW